MTMVLPHNREPLTAEEAAKELELLLKRLPEHMGRQRGLLALVDLAEEFVAYKTLENNQKIMLLMLLEITGALGIKTKAAKFLEGKFSEQ